MNMNMSSSKNLLKKKEQESIGGIVLWKERQETRSEKKTSKGNEARPKEKLAVQLKDEEKRIE